MIQSWLGYACVSLLFVLGSFSLGGIEEEQEETFLMINAVNGKYEVSRHDSLDTSLLTDVDTEQPLLETEHT